MKSQTSIGSNILIAIWIIGNLGTFGYLMATDGPHFNYWNWILLLPIDAAMASAWPLYWTGKIILSLF